MPLHLIKLAVGAQSIDDVKRWQASRPRPLKHQTRNMPRRAAEIIDGGSIYWVINRLLVARQRIVGVQEGRREDGTACTDLLLHPSLIQVQARAVKPFQGWRYLPAADAPADVADGATACQLPEALRRDLASLCLL
jgi:hypothetical protein